MRIYNLIFCSLICYSVSIFAGDPFASNHGFENIELGQLNAKARTYAAYDEYDEDETFVASHPGTNELEITALNSGPLLDAGLLVGDNIIQANGVDFSIEKRPALGTEPREAFGTALWDSSHSENKILQLKVKRGEIVLDFDVNVVAYPTDDEMLIKVCDDIVKSAAGSGGVGGKVVGSIQGLVLLSSGEEKYQELVHKKAEYLINLYNTKAEDISSNWELVYIGTFLGEYYLATGDSRVVDALKWCGHKLAIHSNGLGCVSHNGVNNSDFSQNPYGIRGMAIITTQMLMVFNLMEKSGLLTDSFDIAARDTTEESLLDTVQTTTGAVDYIVGRKTNFSDSQGRSAKFAIAMALTGKLNTDYGRLAAEWLVTKKTQLLYGHAASFCGFWASISALHSIKPTNWEEAISYYNWYKALALAPEDASSLLTYIPGRQNPGGDSYLGTYNVAQAHNGLIAALAADVSKLHIHGGREKNWYKVDGINSYLVEVQTGDYGFATPDYKLYDIGGNASVTVTPLTGYKVSGIRSADGVVAFSGDPAVSVQVDYTNLQKGHRLAVTFIKIDDLEPVIIAGLALHVDASELVNENGASISQIRDLSGFDNPAIQASDSKQPVLVADAINHRSVLHFSGSEYLDFTDLKWSDLMTQGTNGVNSTWYLVTSIEEWMSARPYADSDDHAYCLWGNYSGSSSHFGVYVDRYGFRASIHGTKTFQGPRHPCPENQPVLLEIIYNDGNVTFSMYHAGGQSEAMTVAMGQPSDLRNLDYIPSIGKRTKSNISNYFRGNLGELMIYNETLADTDRQDVRDYLMEKWIPATSHAVLHGLDIPGLTANEEFESYKLNYSYNLIYGEADLDLTQLVANSGAVINSEDQKVYKVSDFPEEGGEVQIRVTSANGSFTRTYKVRVNLVPRVLSVITGLNASANPITQNLFFTDSGRVKITPNLGYKICSIRDINGYVSFLGNPETEVTVDLINLEVAHELTVVTEEILESGLPDVFGLALHLDTSWLDNDNDASLSSWTDYSGKSGSPSQDNIGSQPTLADNGINSRRTVKFSEQRHFRFERTWADFMDQGVNGINSTWFLTLKSDESSPANSSDDGCHQILGDYANRDFGLYADDKGFRASINGTVSTTGPRVSYSIGEAALVEVRFVDGDVTLNVYGPEGLRGSQTVTMGDLAVVESLQNSPNIAREGKWYWDNFWQGQIGEVLIYKDSLTDEDCGEVRNYLLPKWLPVTSGAALASLQIPEYVLNKEFSPYGEQVYEIVMNRGGDRIDLSGLQALNSGVIDPVVLREYQLSEFGQLGGEIVIAVTSANGSFTRYYTIRVVPDRVLYWDFEEGTGEIVENKWPGEATGTLAGATWVTGLKGQGLYFDGVDDSIKMGLNDIKPPCSLSFWIRREYSDDGSCKLLNSADSSIYLSTWYRSRRFAFENKGEFTHTFSYKAPLEVWNSIIITCDSSKTNLFVNGILRETTTSLANIPLDTMGGFKGTIDEFKVYRRVLTNSEIQNDAVKTSDGTGFITEELWYDSFGDSVSDLTTDSRYPESPNATRRISKLQCVGTGDVFGRKVSGFIHAPISGYYQFWITADDSAEFWLSVDESEGNSTILNSLTSWSNEDQWDKYESQQSVLIKLEAGQKYYFKVLHKENGGGDHVAVAWQIPGGAREVIDGSYLSESNRTRPKVRLTIRPGWNLLSLPSSTFDLRPLQSYGKFWVYKDSTTYERSATPQAMQGFWLYSDENIERELTLYSIDFHDNSIFDLHPGWSLVGPLNKGLIPKQVSNIFEWDRDIGAYQSLSNSDFVIPGKGYWLFNVGPETSLEVLLP